MITDTKRLKDVTLEDITTGFNTESKLGNVLKWYLIGFYIQNDKVQIEQLESLFSKQGSLHNKRAYKTEAKTVYNELMKENSEFEIVNPDTNTVMTIADIGNQQAGAIKTSVGVLYKSLNKDKEKNVVDSADKLEKKIAKHAIASDSINTDGINTAKQLLDLAKGTSPIADVAKSVMDNARIDYELKGLKASVLELNTDNLDSIVKVTKDYLTDMHANFPEAFSDIVTHAMELDTQVEDTQKAA